MQISSVSEFSTVMKGKTKDHLAQIALALEVTLIVVVKLLDLL